MISYEHALNIVREIGLAAPSREERVSTVSALHAILSRDVIGDEDIPMFDNAAMDGFAVRARDTWGASSESPLSLPIKGTVAAGDMPNAGSGDFPSAVEIMTGAPMPGFPFDSVIRVEDVEISENAAGRKIILQSPVKAGANVRKRGTDFLRGQQVAKIGEQVTAAHVMAFASLGIGEISVYARPKVAILSTGKELRNLGEPRTSSAQIWNSSGPYLENRLGELRCEVRNMGVVADCSETFRRLVRQSLEWGADMILSTGAVSMGKHDFVVEALHELGATILFHKAAIRPGKPICFGKFRDGAVFFGLPGNPVSTVVGARFFVEPYLRAWMQLPSEKGLPAQLGGAVKKPEGLRCFYKAKVQDSSSGLRVEVLGDQGSYVVSSLLEANAWAVLGEAGDELAAGAEVKVFPLENYWRIEHE